METPKCSFNHGWCMWKRSTDMSKHLPKRCHEIVKSNVTNVKKNVKMICSTSCQNFFCGRINVDNIFAEMSRYLPESIRHFLEGRIAKNHWKDVGKFVGTNQGTYFNKITKNTPKKFWLDQWSLSMIMWFSMPCARNWGLCGSHVWVFVGTSCTLHRIHGATSWLQNRGEICMFVAEVVVEGSFKCIKAGKLQHLFRWFAKDRICSCGWLPICVGLWNGRIDTWRTQRWHE